MYIAVAVDTVGMDSAVPDSGNADADVGAGVEADDKVGMDSSVPDTDTDADADTDAEDVYASVYRDKKAEAEADDEADDEDVHGAGAEGPEPAADGSFQS